MGLTFIQATSKRRDMCRDIVVSSPKAESHVVETFLSRCCSKQVSHFSLTVSWVLDLFGEHGLPNQGWILRAAYGLHSSLRISDVPAFLKLMPSKMSVSCRSPQPKDSNEGYCIVLTEESQSVEESLLHSLPRSRGYSSPQRCIGSAPCVETLRECSLLVALTPS